MGGFGYTGKTDTLLTDDVDVRVQNEREDTWSSLPGRVVAFHPDRQTIDVQPLYKLNRDGRLVDMPVLPDVPVQFPQMGGFAVTQPVKPGDYVHLSFMSANMDNFHETGEAEAGADMRSGNLSDAVAFLSGGPTSKPLPNFNTENMEIRSEDGQFAIEMSEDGKFRMRGSEGNWFDLLAQLAELLAADTLAVAYGSSAGSGHALQFKAQYAEIAGKLRGMAL